MRPDAGRPTTSPQRFSVIAPPAITGSDSARPPRSRIPGRPPTPPSGVVPISGRLGCYAPVAELRESFCSARSSCSPMPNSSLSPVKISTRRKVALGFTTTKRMPPSVAAR
jgi:hypothetical protein